MFKLLAMLLIGMAMGINSHCHADEVKFDTTEKVLFTGFVVLNVVDALQTVDMIRHRPDLYESNALLGKHPSVEQVWTYKTIIVGGTYLVLKHADNISPLTRKVILGVADAIVFTAVEHNRSLGLRANISF